jgi:hypothetical protein
MRRAYDPTAPFSSRLFSLNSRSLTPTRKEVLLALAEALRNASELTIATCNNFVSVVPNSGKLHEETSKSAMFLVQ